LIVLLIIIVVPFIVKAILKFKKELESLWVI
jgi:hypothetical protein